MAEKCEKALITIIVIDMVIFKVIVKVKIIVKVIVKVMKKIVGLDPQDPQCLHTLLPQHPKYTTIGHHNHYNQLLTRQRQQELIKFWV